MNINLLLQKFYNTLLRKTQTYQYYYDQLNTCTDKLQLLRIKKKLYLEMISEFHFFNSFTNDCLNLSFSDQQKKIK